MNKVRKLTLITSLLAITILLNVTFVPPANASDPTIINDVWFVVMQTSAVSGAASILNDIYNSTGATIFANILRSPPGTQGSTVIGNAKTRIDLLFNNITKQGLATISMTLNFSDANLTRNPYGVGVIQAKATNVAVTSLFPSANPGVGNASGTLVSTSGTGAFVNAVLVVDFIMTPYPSASTGPNEAMFFGSHSRVNGRGMLTTYYLPPTTNNDAWFVVMPTSAAVNSTNTSAVSGIYRNIGYTTRYGIMRSPPGAAGSVQIGTANSTINVTYDTSNGIGSATIAMTLNFTDTNSTRNPYGVGTLQGKATNVTVTSLLSSTNLLAGNATGFMVASTGTGAFAKALLAEDFIMNPFPSLASGPMVAMFFGTHTRVNGTGLLAFQNLPPALSVSTTQSSNTVAAWSMATLSANVIGGYAPCIYQWTLSGTNMGTTPSISVMQSQPGTYVYNLTVTDSQSNMQTVSVSLIVTAPAQNTTPTPIPTSAPTQTPAPSVSPTPTVTPTPVPTTTATPPVIATSTPHATNVSNEILVWAAIAVVIIAVIVVGGIAVKLKKH